MDIAGQKRWPIHWLEVTPPGKRRKKKPLMVAVCGKARAVIKVQTSFIDPIVITDFYIDEAKQRCEEGERCFNTACPLNHTTPDSLAKGFGMKRRPSWMKTVQPIPVDEALQRVIDEVCAAHPTDGVVRVYR